MKVAMYYANDDVRLEEMPTPEIGPAEVLVRLRMAASNFRLRLSIRQR